MKVLSTSQTVQIPKKVKITCKARKVVVKGPKGTLRRDFSHLSLEMVANKGTFQVRLQMGNRATIAAVRTVCTHVSNMIKGVTTGYRYNMRLVYAHFPIGVNIENDGKLIELRNFLGEKIVRTIQMRGDAKVSRGGRDNKDVVVEGSDLDAVSQSAANIQQSCRVKNKDIRKFLDGVYVDTSGAIVVDDEAN
jgi:large subunit ribosomal protein L9e